MGTCTRVYVHSQSNSLLYLEAVEEHLVVELDDLQGGCHVLGQPHEQHVVAAKQRDQYQRRLGQTSAKGIKGKPISQRHVWCAQADRPTQY